VDHETRTLVAGRLLAAYESREPIPPLTSTYEGMTLEDAYAIQLLQVKRLAARAHRAGHKVGLTSAAMQQQLGVTEPDYGHLLDDFFYLEHMPIPVGTFLQPRVEPEIAFVLEAAQAARA
jgi:2-keto-4-pentenoate hydratase